MRWLKRVLILLGILFIVYLLGPTPDQPVYNATLPTVPAGADSLEQYVSALESRPHIKPDNEARIIWANDSLKQPTEYALVYLHGFSASQQEGAPVHRELAKKLKANLYLARLSEHGIDTTDALLHMTASSLWETARDAYAIGKRLGKKVILMGTSTGGTLALQLAATYPDIAALLLLSPNIAINDPNAWIANNHWGLQIARLVKGSELNMVANKTDEYKKYWNTQYRLEAVTELQELLETTMTKATFSKVTQPVLVLYYYKNEQQQDPVVKVSAMRTMFQELGTPDSLKRMVAIPNAGSHVLASPIQSKDIISVEKEAGWFLQHILKAPVEEP
jgi:esterase/lipase